MDCSYGQFTNKLATAARHQVREGRNLQIHVQLQSLVQAPNPKLQSQVSEMLRFAESNFGTDMLLVSAVFFTRLSAELQAHRLTIPVVLLLASTSTRDQDGIAETLAQRFGLAEKALWTLARSVLLELDHDLFVSRKEIEDIRAEIEE
ncbi:hypothetical protein SS50377_26439 [Spironucleus salmonicida]|uniref:Uncharacterized protein n=1 Tax=Spironucleus salmonicida TaxID=348837 RepID=V6LKU2_9EUKA|nr:hypothetical protein SS50377_26429 [Spironucleus salmonicida]KAH0572229.1 hypothetical protein SS50377_26439 [Spironucleus salmonicida]|eukprot:EST41299.1 Hypothetical protein SS50377_19012 [Spironucleus salmonicida]